MKLDIELFQWLQQQGILQPRAITDSFIQLELKEYEGLLQGALTAQLLGNLVQQQIETKPGGAPGVKLFNWNNISAALNKIGIQFDDDIKMAIVKGDWDMLKELLREIKIQLDSAQQIEQQLSTDPATTIIPTEPTEIELSQIDPQKPLQATNSLLEFILVSLVRHFEVKPRQAVLFLQNGYKLLSNMLIQGYRKNYKSVVNWLIELSKQTSTIVKFSFNVDTLLSLIRAGLVSKSSEVTYWTLFIYSNIISELQATMLEDVYAWFVREHGGLIATILSSKRHPQFIDTICNLYGIVARYNEREFFDVQLRKMLKSGKEYIDFLNSIVENAQLRDQMKAYMSFFAQHAIKIFEPQNTYNEKMTAFKYFEFYWIYFPEEFESQWADQYLFNLRKATREQNFTLRIFCFVSLFRVLDHLAERKDKYAALLYKKLVFSLIENFDEKEVREVLVANLLMLIKKYSTIPIDIFLVPMVKQLSISDNEVLINICDFLLLREACTHPKLDLAVAIQMLDMLCKVYLNSIIFHQQAFQQIQILFSRFIEAPSTKELAYNVCKVALAEYYGNFSESIKNYPNYAIQYQHDDKIIKQQQRSQIIQLVKYIIHLRQFDLNEQIKSLISHFYLEISQNLKVQSKALTMLLTHFGDVAQVLEEYKKEFKLQQPKIQTPKQQPNQNSSRLPQKIKPKSEPDKLDPFTQMRMRESQAPKAYMESSMLQTLSLSYEEQQLLKQFDMI